MVSSTYRITEPHPSVPTTHYIHSGRGGAGNISHIDPKGVTSAQDATGPASRTKLNSQHANHYISGRGGAGNIHTNERPIFSFDEELDRQRRMMEHQAPVYHVGRGGAGNYASETAGSLARRGSSGTDASASSRDSVRHSVEATWSRLRGSFAKPQ
ncbi:hypothetical protein BT63DRAFT_154866 [Microthyrium microscopicum]|uniref:Uncharacterized protein n=1 Tax=Microthyrium microscopicum TaxID=703497 RepID=A0A6A6UM88_9PEZI|nr:hypothetical protein BT63DRAFT_154866 [Microthyrium microscopicum]